MTAAAYAPDGPIHTAPRGAFIPPKARREMFLAVLDGVELGDYDRVIVDWICGMDDATCRTVISLIGRARQAERAS
jgi:hypothetical protein